MITDPELRRHASMVMVSGMALVSGSILLMLAKQQHWFLSMRFAIVAFLMMLLLDLRFVHSYTSEARTVIAQDIAWKDYFDTNRYIATLRPKGVIASSGEGLVLPIVNEVATALVPKLAVLAHQRVSGEAVALLQGSSSMGAVEIGHINRQWLSLARAAGFDTVVWGPVEEARWGHFGRRILLEGAEWLAQFGEVGVYRFPAAALGGMVRSVRQVREGTAFNHVCTAHIRSALRRAGIKLVSDLNGYSVRSGSLGAIQVGTRLDKDLGGGREEVPCDLELLRSSAPIEASADSLQRRVVLDSSMTVQQSSNGDGSGRFGPETLLEGARSNDGMDSSSRYALTGWEREPWWQIDLGQEFDLTAIQVDRATPPPPYGVQHLAIVISEKPFQRESVDPFTYGSRSYFVDGDWPRNRPIGVSGTRGRYVRVQLAGDGALSPGLCASGPPRVKSKMRKNYTSRYAISILFACVLFTFYDHLSGEVTFVGDADRLNAFLNFAKLDELRSFSAHGYVPNWNWLNLGFNFGAAY
ncbi:MAG: hypothetical protein IPK29_14000 [Betaproteobacteria bacterium]|nr:hypothetical protein [Betaproteobacteria bacterium]